MDQELLLQESLLYTWMRMSVFIRGNRILSELSFNEVMICGLLLRRQGGSPLTATELCAQTNLLKSQVNHILTTMESRGLIQRVRSTTDKRVVFVHLLEEGRALYQKEHQRVMEIMKAVYDALGSDKTRELTALIAKATAVVDDYCTNTSSN